MLLTVSVEDIDTDQISGRHTTTPVDILSVMLNVGTSGYNEALSTPHAVRMNGSRSRDPTR